MDKGKDTLQDTFELYFGETEDTHGTGIATRVINGVLTDVIVDKEEHERWLAECRAEADRRNAEVDARHRLEAWYYPEEN